MALSSEARTAGNEVIIEQLSRIWESILGIDSIQPDQDYFDLGGDSSLAVQMFARIEKLFQVKLPLATLYEASTIAGLARIIGGETASSGWSPLVSIQPAGSRPPFFCFHGAGGNVLNYQKLSGHMGPDQPFYGLQSQGLDGVSPPLTSIQEMAALYIKKIRTVQPYGPYFLGGYCMGGTIAYEAAQQLTSAGETVALLALLDTMNWHKIPLTFRSRSSHACQQVLFHAASLLDLSFADKVRFLKDKAEVLRHRIPVWRGMLASAFAKRSAAPPSTSVILGRIWQMNDRASWRYIPQPYPGTVTDIRPARQYRVFSKPDLKWDQLAQGGQHVIVLPVYPASMLVEPFVAQLARSLRACMDEAISGSQHQKAMAQSR
ncbi:MAG: hypothetical protein IT166_17820 [Bryobacterales bacterium]|nr:hypothetical protein [Bryobacterales bacterium]